MTLEKILSRTIKVGECLVWTGATKGSGRKGQRRYPSLRYKGKNCGGHRIVYLLSKGEFDSTLHVCHTCDNTLCVNPNHLFLGNHKENMQDKIRKGRDHNQRKATCPKGHPYSGDNLYINPDGSRKCRTCIRKSYTKFDSANREARRLAAINRYYENRDKILARKRELRALRKEVQDD